MPWVPGICGLSAAVPFCHKLHVYPHWMQVATRKAAVLFDLITLASQHPAALDDCLQPLFASSETLKLGFAVSGDVAKLANSWPQIQAFQHVAGVLDLKTLWIAYGISTRRQVIH